MTISRAHPQLQRSHYLNAGQRPTTTTSATHCNQPAPNYCVCVSHCVCVHVRKRLTVNVKACVLIQEIKGIQIADEQVCQRERVRQDVWLVGTPTHPLNLCQSVEPFPPQHLIASLPLVTLSKTLTRCGRSYTILSHLLRAAKFVMNQREARTARN